jgi:hypothetical protein
MDLGATSIDVVEVPPGQHVDTTNPGGDQAGGEVVDGQHDFERTAPTSPPGCQDRTTIVPSP